MHGCQPKATAERSSSSLSNASAAADVTEALGSLMSCYAERQAAAFDLRIVDSILQSLIYDFAGPYL